MIANDGIYRLVYEYYEARILFGYYSCGDSLPSIPKICSMFGMAAATVRAALTLLEKGGYIRLDARKTAKVIYQASNLQFQENLAEYLMCREEGISDIIRSGEYLFGPLWEKGMSLWDEKMLEKFHDNMKKPEQGLVSMPVEFYVLALEGLNNNLILNLFWETIRYLRFPYLVYREEKEISPHDVTGESIDEVVRIMKEKLEHINKEIVSEISGLMAEVCDKSRYETRQIPFEWVIYLQRPQIRYTLASRMIREIMHGCYPAGSYLPSLTEMAQKYGAGLSTIRRTLHILDCLGFVRSYHGKGTKVCMELGRLDCSGKEIQEGMRLYRECLQLLALTIRAVSQYTLESVEDTKRIDLAGKFAALKNGRRSFLCFEVYLHFIYREIPSNMIRECYGRMTELLAWGYPFAVRRRKDGNLFMEYDGFVAEAERDLRVGDIKKFSENWESLMIREEQKLDLC